MAGLIAKNYCDAIFEIAKEDNILDVYKEQLSFIDQVMKEVDFYNVLAHPKISHMKKKEMLVEAFAQNIDATLLNFLKLLIDKGHIRSLHDIVKEYEKNYNELHQIQVVYVTSALTLQDDEVTRLRETLQQKLQKSVELKCRVDEDLIAGLRIKINDKIIDNSAKSKLSRLQKHAETMNI